MKGKVIGDILVLKDNAETNRADNPQELLKIPGVNRVVRLGRINGPRREPDVEILVGEGTETVHRENHCFFKLDVSRIMWSKGNTTERKRMAQLVQDGEIIVDLFAGIGYFTIPMAVHANPSKIYAVEINPVAHDYLSENVEINQVQDVVEPILGNCREVAPRNIADRVLMGYIGNTNEYLDVARDVVKNEGVIHYHESVPDKLKFIRPAERVKESFNGFEVDILNQRVIKKYSPGVYHVVVDAKVYKN
ncbi:class I SAM-dependent methyltransferase [Methanobacterium ferruginis]|uniref:class I SAM-dependent methyltransferase n=1 Tax=Methanobacterium ferruginis TaxID=710191 RepID=UPI0025732755|nr:class I SAM-dependent methyltransferase family protein [Methanobacterium ferruginis]BDZ66890.1 SAM-dependent methyltransferase [Methanobacterium ferruginis]